MYTKQILWSTIYLLLLTIIGNQDEARKNNFYVDICQAVICKCLDNKAWRNFL